MRSCEIFLIQMTGGEIVVQNEIAALCFEWNMHDYMDLPKILLLDMRATKCKMHLQ